MVRKTRIKQVELPFDPPSRLILQHAAAVELINPLPLGGDQQQLDFVVKLGRQLMTVPPVGSVFKMFESLLMLGAKRLNDVLRQFALCG
jgi:hypothetical protein